MVRAVVMPATSSSGTAERTVLASVSMSEGRTAQQVA